jgi:hypothetical protein
MQIWTAADPSFNEALPGNTIMSYNNAKVHTLSLNGMKTVVNTQVRVNQMGTRPRIILPATTFLDTESDMDTENAVNSTGSRYSGAQLYMLMHGMKSTSFLPNIQLVFEYDCEFKQPALQNRPNTFELSFVGSSLVTIPDQSTPEVTREYKVVAYTLNDSGNNIRLERADGQPGSLDYTQAEFWEVYFNQNSGSYFGGRKITYTGPIPRKPLDWSPN